MECVYCAVRTESINVVEVSVSLYITGQTMGKSDTGRNFAPLISVSPVSIIPLVIHTDTHLDVSLTRRTN